MAKKENRGRYRGSPRDRGYDSKWDKLSVVFRRRNPFCKWCAEQDRISLTAVVDHILPVVDRPDLKYEWSNLLPLCHHHHGTKASMEIYARENGLIEMLPEWCANPESRPARCRIFTGGTG
ncbi:MAG: HNH endonuclease signature motif containing protein [Hyphomicrobiales bacterium]|nr:HNH endonuclease signature motif containing protein [Hyphomicrobiales bacterium]